MYLEEVLRNKIKSSVAINYLVKNGKIKLNGHVVLDPRMPADERDNIEIDSDNLSRDNDYWNFMLNDQESNLIENSDTIVFFGSRKEGLLDYCKEKTQNLFVVDAFEHNTKTIIENPLRISYDEIMKRSGSKADLIFVDAGLDIIKSMEIVHNNIPLLAIDGKIIIHLNNSDRDNDGLEAMSRKFLEDFGLNVLKINKMSSGIEVISKRS